MSSTTPTTPDYNPDPWHSAAVTWLHGSCDWIDWWIAVDRIANDPAEISLAIARHYDGGVDQFTTDMFGV